MLHILNFLRSSHSKILSLESGVLGHAWQQVCGIGKRELGLPLGLVLLRMDSPLRIGRYTMNERVNAWPKWLHLLNAFGIYKFLSRVGLYIRLLTFLIHSSHCVHPKSSKFSEMLHNGLLLSSGRDAVTQMICFIDSAVLGSRDSRMSKCCGISQFNFSSV